MIQVLRSERRGDQAPVLAAVGPLQFDVVTARLAAEFHAPITLERLGYQLARRTDAAGEELLAGQHEVEVLLRGDGTRLALFTNKYRLDVVARRFPDLRLDAIPAGAVVD